MGFGINEQNGLTNAFSERNWFVSSVTTVFARALILILMVMIDCLHSGLVLLWQVIPRIHLPLYITVISPESFISGGVSTRCTVEYARTDE